MSVKRFENRLNRDNVKFNTLNPVWDNQCKDALNVFEMTDKLNELTEERKQHIKKIDRLEDDLDYYKSKAGSCEEGLLHVGYDYYRYQKKVSKILKEELHWLKNTDEIKDHEKIVAEYLLKNIIAHLDVI